ncbi:endonuclease/exonuclease/phosphatase family protein [Campylobacter sp. FMV-PI01]|uniref:Endonuclease/exonuclease/phosphatase family protein n=1 Tax=Campylobacter portucalensis TaxID=2608384 RepID=A0A6L5WMP7_9BACT|nr:endonuclease/exonuclease/phosphatase family protein [Campylobacter portucalensis]MSN97103.1 endonuclease/exonuclease/phosphatase family protein [Campylobacter portucalensis]
MRIFICLIVFCLSVFCAELKIATFNVENLFDDVNNGSEYKNFVIGKSSWNKSKYDTKLNLVSKLLKIIDADIIALQEIENEGVLRSIAKNIGYKNYVFSKDKKSPFGLGIISKIPIKSKEIYRIKGIKTRDFIKARFSFNGQEFTITTAHFPAMKNSKRDRKIVANEFMNFIKNDKHSILLGDFNSRYGYEFLLNNLSNYKNLWQEKNARQRISHISGSAIDHIILSSDFFNGNDISYLKNSFEIFNDSKFFNSKFKISDHYPLVFKITTNSQKFKTTTIWLNNIDEIYGKTKFSKNFGFKNLALTYKDKNGFVLSDQNGRGLYFYGKINDLELGDLVDVLIYSAQIYKDNYEIDNYQILKTQKTAQNLDNYLLDVKNINIARHGDVVREIQGKVINGELVGEFGVIKVYSYSRKLKNSEHEVFERAFFTKFKGQRELIVK